MLGLVIVQLRIQKTIIRVTDKIQILRIKINYDAGQGKDIAKSYQKF